MEASSPGAGEGAEAAFLLFEANMHLSTRCGNMRLLTQVHFCDISPWSSLWFPRAGRASCLDLLLIPSLCLRRARTGFPSFVNGASHELLAQQYSDNAATRNLWVLYAGSR
jgi:hypothetical protein